MKPPYLPAWVRRWVDQHQPRLCPRTGRVIARSSLRPKAGWVFAALGFLSFVWFLVRVIPKPSRAAYPCQRAAFPVATGFVVWLLAALGTWKAYRQARIALRRSRFIMALTCVAAATALAGLTFATWPEKQAQASAAPTSAPVGVAKGIHPGRVVWAHAPEATDWAGFNSPERWWDPKHTDLATVEEMFSRVIQGVAGEATDAAAWEALFKNFNATRGRGSRGYQAGEKIAVKINLTACNARSTQVNPTTYEKNADVMNTIDNSPQMLLALLRHLVYTVGARPSDLSVGDPTGLFPQFMWNLLHPEFPDVQYFDNSGGAGRVRVEFSSTPFHWSTPSASGKRQDYVPVPFAQATYLINFAVLKGHSSGVTLCAKNLYGALLRCPDGYLRNQGTLNYYDMHLSLPNAGWSPGLGHYRALVDLLGHAELGGKTLLCLVDGLYGGYYWDSHPVPWKTRPFGDGTQGDWPSSLFGSQDPVAIDSVCYDFLLNEWPKVVTTGGGATGSLQGGAEDYLHEAALASNPPSATFYDPDQNGTRLPSLGVHEHWNNPTDKQYSRNRGLTQGIELVALAVPRPSAELACRRSGDRVIVSWRGALTEYHLQSADGIASSFGWQTVSTTPTLVQGRSTVTNTLTAARQFYRLVK